MFLMYYAIKKNNNFKKLDEVKIQIHNLVGFFLLLVFVKQLKRQRFSFHTTRRSY